MDICIEKDTIYRVPLYSLTNFDWDNLYVIQGPRIDHEVDEITKIEYNKIVPDGPVLLLFINNGSVVKDRLSYCHGIDLYWRLDTCSVGYYKYSYNSIVEIETFMGEDGRLFLQVISDTICPLQETP